MPSVRARRISLALLAAALVAVVPAAHAKRQRPITLRMHFPVPPGDLEVCQFVPVPVSGPYDSVAVDIRNVGVRSDFVSHHFLLYAYTGTDVAGFPKPDVVQPSKACLDFGPSDRNSRLLIGGSQGRSPIQQTVSGLAQRIQPVVVGDGKKALGLILNSHWINGSTRVRRAAVKVRIVPAKPHTVKRFVDPIFDVVANGLIFVAPRHTHATATSLDFGTFHWHGWGPGGPDPLPGSLGAPPMPSADACVVALTAHMHKRGKLFSVEFVDEATGSRSPIFQADDYTDPGVKLFDPPLRVNVGQKIQYSCLHDNGVSTTVKLGCEEQPGKAPGAPPLSTAKRCYHLGPDPDDCPATDSNLPGRKFTGNCVEANLVFGFSSDDDMCILPGVYYPADPTYGCDLGPLPTIN